MTQIIPAIIPKNKKQLEDEIRLVSSFSDVVHIDISDGKFTKVKTWPYNGADENFFEKLKHEEVGWPEWETVSIELHCMMTHPEIIVSDFISTGISTFIFHIESTEHVQEIIDICHNADVFVGLAIKPSTDISLLALFVSQIDFIHCMDSDILGRHGVSLEERAIEHIQKLHAMYPESIISVDIGVNLETKERLLEAGATRLVVGSAILEADNPKEMFLELSK